MALFHFHVTQVKRSVGQSVVTQATYRAREKLYSNYYDEVSDYTHKGGVVCSDIILPLRAPPEYKDRETLWNAVENAERGKKAQLAYSFDIALQNELTMDENIALARQFVSEYMVGRGMIADFAVHSPDKGNGIQNPHFHILCPIRPLDEKGKWGSKQHRAYRKDENGEPILGADGKPLFDAVPTTDWGAPETLEFWREKWAAMVNAKFEEKVLSCRIDHRSFTRQGIEQIPTVHEGPAVRQMESRSIITNKGELNRWIKLTNNLIKDVKRKIKSLLKWIGEVKEELSRPQSPSLGDLIGVYYTDSSNSAYSQKAKTSNLKKFAETVRYLQENNLLTIEDLELRVTSAQNEVNARKKSMKAKTDRADKLKKLLKLVGDYKELACFKFTNHIVDKYQNTLLPKS